MNIEDIISKLLAGEAGAEELKYLEEWRGQSAANLEELEKIQAIQNGVNSLEGYKSFDVDAAWEAVDSATSEEAEVVDLFAYKKWIALAAACAVAVLGVMTLLNGETFTFQKEQLHFAASNNSVSNELPDGTIITLDQGATADIKSDFLDAPLVTMEGRVYFEVAKQLEGKPFIVDLNKGSIEVVGTEFSILDNTENTEISVAEGHVIFKLDNRSVDLYAGDMIRVINNDLLKTSGKAGNYTSWYTKELVFNAKNLKAAFVDVERHFNTKIEILESVSLSDCHISGTYKNQSLTSILDEWSTILDLAYIIENNKVIIQSVVCK